MTIQVNLNESIESIKQKIYEKWEIPTYRQSLIFRGVLLKDDETLSDHNILKESTLHLIVARGE